MRTDLPNADNHAPGRPAGLSPLFEPVGFGAIDGWREDDHAAALSCFRISARRMIERPYTTKALGVDARALLGAARLALAIPDNALADEDSARGFFELAFLPWRIAPGQGTGFVTGYYEPEVPASAVPTKRFSYPLYGRPPDLAEIDDSSRPAGMDPAFRFARQTAKGLVEYHDREAIENGALAGRGLELAWIESPIDGFFIHIQGSARLLMQDGSVRRISYAGKSGHPFTAIGRLLVERGQMRRDEATMASIRAWLEADMTRARALMAENRSFIFFAESARPDPALGPVAAASVPLTAGRSVALDHSLHTFGTPVWIATHEPLPTQSKPFRRLMIGQDTGSAILGPARGDLFIGSGAEAGNIAGAIRHSADFIALVPIQGEQG